VLDNPRLTYSDRLTLLESRDLLGRIFKLLHGRELGATKAVEILAHLAQGRAYLAAATSAAEIVRPLLQYYATLAYTRAYVLLLSHNLREAALASGHGLTAVGWKEHLASGGSWLDARLRVDAGTFSQLAAVTRNLDVVEVPDPSGKRLQLQVPGSASFTVGWELRVGDIVSRYPSLVHLYETVTGQAANCWSCAMFNMDVVLEFQVVANAAGLPPADLMTKLFSLRSTTDLKRGESSQSGLGLTREWQLALPLADHQELATCLANVRVEEDAAYLIDTYPEDVRLSRVSTLFALAYAQGMLVRYYPTHWRSLLSGTAGDHALPVIRATSDAVRAFPDVMLDALAARQTINVSGR
jgi:hypothetical protein